MEAIELSDPRLTVSRRDKIFLALAHRADGTQSSATYPAVPNSAEEVRAANGSLAAREKKTSSLGGNPVPIHIPNIAAVAAGTSRPTGPARLAAARDRVWSLAPDAETAGWDTLVAL